MRASLKSMSAVMACLLAASAAPAAGSGRASEVLPTSGTVRAAEILPAEGTVRAAEILPAEGRTLINNDWTFHLGDASSMEKDFTHGTEYFTYIAKAQSSNHNRGPVMPAFDDSAWERVSLPHDWVVDLPFSAEASHSHGYKCIGWKYPQNSVGWYRKRLLIPESLRGKRILLEFDGIFRNSQVFCNGFYLGGRDDGYLQQTYDLSDYLDYGAENLVCVRCDASLEEGWYYEGAGIYRNVYLKVTPQAAALPDGILTYQSYNSSSATYSLKVKVTATVADAAVHNELLDEEGRTVAVSDGSESVLQISSAHEWSPKDPYLYKLVTTVGDADVNCTAIGLRRAEFSAEKGFVLNGEKLVLKGCNLHQDHAGVGTAIPDALWRYRLERLRDYGFNAIRSSHNPASPSMLSLCDSLGFVVIDENREFGTNERQLGNLHDMIVRDQNHPCVVLWSVGNEEWALEWTPKGSRIACRMCEYARSVDPTRLCTYGNSGGRELVKGADVFGYNYIVQNPVLEYHESFPDKTAVGTEETTGAGTRGHYRTVPEEGWMQPLNRRDTAGVVNAIERGWKFYRDNAWTCGIFYWTGFDYRGEPNPMLWPATGSQFGIFDYCGFPKDEAFYLKAAWTREPVLHICGEAEDEIWVYSNCREVELFKGRRSLGRKLMPQDGYLSWKVGDCSQAAPGTYTAKAVAALENGSGRSRMRITDTWPYMPAATTLSPSRSTLVRDGQDVVVIDIESPLDELEVCVEGAQLLGWGNGNPGFKEIERPKNGSTSISVKPFACRCQVLVRSVAGLNGPVTITAGSASAVLH